jgi:hypothetical protein
VEHTTAPDLTHCGVPEIVFNSVSPIVPTAASVYLYVSDADALYAEWAALDNLAGRLIEPHEMPYSLREFAYIDPDGTLHRIGSRAI